MQMSFLPRSAAGLRTKISACCSIPYTPALHTPILMQETNPSLPPWRPYFPRLVYVQTGGMTQVDMDPSPYPLISGLIYADLNSDLMFEYMSTCTFIHGAELQNYKLQATWYYASKEPRGNNGLICYA